MSDTMSLSNCEWKETTLGEVCNFQEGYVNPSQKEPSYFGDEIKWLRANDLNESYVYDTSRKLSRKGFASAGKAAKLFKPNTIGISKSGSIGKLGFLKDYMCGNRAVINIEPKSDIDVRFLFSLLKANQPYFPDLAVGSVQPNLYVSALASLEISLPPLSEQTAIASVLSSLDDKIDLLHCQNATLEKMAETLFRQWFVEEAKEDWEMGKLGDEFDFVMGASPPGESYNEQGNGVPMYQGNADFGFRFPTNRVFTTDPKRFAEKFDTLISVRAPVGEQNMANERCCIGRGVAAFRFKKDNSFYTYTYYKMKSLMDDIKQFNETGTVFGSISKSDFESIDSIIPDLETINSFQAKIKSIDDKVLTNTTQIRTLTALRDTLLPKLMSGEVRVV